MSFWGADGPQDWVVKQVCTPEVLYPCHLAFVPFGPGQDCLWYWLAGDKILGLAYEHSFGLMELWIQALLIGFHFVWGLSMVMVWGLYFCIIRSCSVSTPEGGPTGANFSLFSQVQI